MFEQRRAFRAPLLLRLYSHIRHPSERSGGRSERSMRLQLPFDLWLAISTSSAADHPAASSSVIACLCVRGSAETAEAAKAHPWPSTPADAESCGR
eukprot:6186968-Pleurochrysis_carterae.AAC.13